MAPKRHARLWCSEFFRQLCIGWNCGLDILFLRSEMFLIREEQAIELIGPEILQSDVKPSMCENLYLISNRILRRIWSWPSIWLFYAYGWKILSLRTRWRKFSPYRYSDCEQKYNRPLQNSSEFVSLTIKFN